MFLRLTGRVTGKKRGIPANGVTDAGAIRPANSFKDAMTTKGLR